MPSRLAVLAAAIAALLSAIAVAPARAHGTLIASSPADGAVIAAPPAQFTLTFNEPVSPLVLRLVAPDGSTQVLQSPAGRDASLTIQAPAGLRDGTHLLSWRVVSLDSHPIGGTVVFSIGAPSTAPQADVASTDTAVTAALWLGKSIVYLALAIGVGGAFFLAWIAAERSRSVPPIVIACVVGLVVTPVLIGLQGADALGVPLQGLSRKIAWQTGLETSFGLTAIAMEFALFGALFAAQANARRVARSLSLFGLVTLGLAVALSGHASLASPEWLTRPAVGIHAIAVAFWIGSLVPLAAAMRDPANGAPTLAAFSRLVPLPIAALIVTGVLLAVIQVQRPDLLLTTAYGQLLSAKLFLVAVLLTIAAGNRLRLTPAIRAGAETAGQALRRTIAVELAIAFVIFGLVAAWRFTPPPRSIALAAAQPMLLHIHTAEAMADVKLIPGDAGLARVEVIIMRGDFSGLDAKEVQLTFENKRAGIEPIARQAAKGDDAIWRVDGLPIAGGEWEVRVDILVDDFQKIMLDGRMERSPR